MRRPSLLSVSCTPRPSPGCASRSTMRRFASPATTRLIWPLSMLAALARWPSDIGSSDRPRSAMVRHSQRLTPNSRRYRSSAPRDSRFATRCSLKDSRSRISVIEEWGFTVTAETNVKPIDGALPLGDQALLQRGGHGVQHRIFRRLEEHHGLELAHQAGIQQQEVDVWRTLAVGAGLDGAET